MAWRPFLGSRSQEAFCAWRATWRPRRLPGWTKVVSKFKMGYKQEATLRHLQVPCWTFAGWKEVQENNFSHLGVWLLVPVKNLTSVSVFVGYWWLVEKVKLQKGTWRKVCTSRHFAQGPMQRDWEWTAKSQETRRPEKLRVQKLLVLLEVFSP